MTEFKQTKIAPTPAIPTNLPITVVNGGSAAEQSFFTTGIQKGWQILNFLNDKSEDFETYGRSSPTKKICVGVGLFILACLFIYLLTRGIRSLTGSNIPEKKKKLQ